MKKDDSLKMDIVGIVKVGSRSAFSYVMADGRIIPAVMGGSDGPAPDDTKPPVNGDQGKVTFLPEQQAKIQELIDEAYKKAYAKAKSSAPDKTLEDENRTLKAELDRLKAEKKTEGKGGEDLSALQARIAALEADKQKSIALSKHAQMLAAAGELNAVSADQVAILLDQFVHVDETGQLSVKTADGKTPYNAQGAPMSVKEFMAKYLAENPHLVKASGAPGAGSKGAQLGQDAVLAELAKLPPEERLNRARAMGMKT